MVLMAQVARRHYIGQQSKVRIASDLGLSRFQVARLLDSAVKRGIIRFEVGISGDVDLGLSAELREMYGLSHCVVVETPDESAATLCRYVGTTITELLAEMVTDSDVLGVSTTRALMGLTSPPSRFARCAVVQMTGAISRLDAFDVMDAVRRFTRVGGGPAYLYYAPMLCHRRIVANECRQQPDFLRCRGQYQRLTVAAVGIGAWEAGQSQLYAAADERDRDQCRSRGVVAEVSGLLLDKEGRVVEAPLSERIVGIQEAELRRVPTRIGLAFDIKKAHAIRAALAARLINALVIPRSLAEEVLRPSPG